VGNHSEKEGNIHRRRAQKVSTSENAEERQGQHNKGYFATRMGRFSRATRSMEKAVLLGHTKFDPSHVLDDLPGQVPTSLAKDSALHTHTRQSVAGGLGCALQAGGRWS